MSLRTPKRSRTNEEQEQEPDQEQEQEQGQNLDTHMLHHQQQRPGHTTLLSTPVRIKNGFGTPSPPSPPGTTNSITKSRRTPSATTLQGTFMSPVNKRRVGAAAHGRVSDHDENGHESGSEDDENENENENENKNHLHRHGHAGMTLLPPTTPKSRRSEVFLSPSPRLRSPPTATRRSASERPIREISHTLRTRLNYALVKLQNGWTDKTLPELETELAPAAQTTSPRRYHNRFPDSADAGTSAHTAFLQALGGHPPREEATAVETLMLLSSPTKKQQHRPVAVSSAGEPTDETEPESDTEVETS